MNPTPHIATLRQTHRTATSLLPVVTAALTVAGVVIAALEARTPHAEDEAAPGAATTEQAGGDMPIGAQATSRASAGRVTLRAYIATLIGRALMVALGIALVLSLVYIASVSGRVGLAILLTALILLALYLTEKVARRA